MDQQILSVAIFESERQDEFPVKKHGCKYFTAFDEGFSRLPEGTYYESGILYCGEGIPDH